MRTKRIFMVLSLFTLLAFMAGGITEAKTSKATGPFKYDPKNFGDHDFYGTGGSPATGSFEVCAPEGDKFPTGRESAGSTIRVFGIKKVGDAEGDPVDPAVNVPLEGSLGGQIAVAFSVSPSSYTFDPGTCVNVSVTISNPDVSSTDYGIYIVTVKAHSPGSGVGAGTGSIFVLGLWPPVAPSDTTPPNVTINSPTNGSIHVLGPIAVSITANDPAPGTGVSSMTATVSSSGGAVSNSPVTLTTNTPQAAGSNATGTGTFTPTGGTGTTGTTCVSAFNATSRSGIGAYTLVATATDGASNTGTASSTFDVKYNVNFTQTHVVTTGPSANQKQKVQLKFTVNRSSTTSDGAFMYDRTVKVKLHRKAGSTWSEAGTHVFTLETDCTAGDPKDYVKITETPAYETNFENLPVSDAYKSEVLFVDVDGSEVVQGVTVEFQ